MKRRELLRNAAALGAAYPFLGSAMAPTGKVIAKKKLVILPVELGYYDKFFYSTTDDPTDSPLIKCLSPVKDKLTVFRHIGQPEVGAGHGNAIRILTCNRRQSDGAMMSVDQVAAEAIEQRSRFKHVNLGRKGFSWNKHSRFAHSERDIGPKAVYEKLFTKYADDAALERKIAALKLMQLKAPRHATDAYRTAIAELEAEVAVDLEWNKKPIPKVEVDTNLNLTDAHGRGAITPVAQQLKMVRLALQHQRMTVAVASPPHVDKTSQIGVSGTYHQLGHRTSSKVEGYYEQLLKLELHLFNAYRDFLVDMEATGQLDDTIVMIMGSFNDAGRHQRKSVPTVVVGGGFDHKGLIECVEKDEIKIQLSHLYLSILRQMGIDAADFGGNRTSVDHLLG